ncbi:hypothetical protein LTR94_036454, partial [Friedmanniomyces endolithicus]
ACCGWAPWSDFSMWVTALCRRRAVSRPSWMAPASGLPMTMPCSARSAAYWIRCTPIFLKTMESLH